MIGRGLLLGAHLVNNAQCWEQRLLGRVILHFWVLVLRVAVTISP